MTKEEYGDFLLRYKGCGACFPMYHTLSRFEKMWFSAIQKYVAEIEKENAELKEKLEIEQNARGDWFGKVVAKDRRLNEAIEIIKKYYKYNPSCEYFYEDIDKEAEQFLKDC